MSFLDSAEDPKHARRRPLQLFLVGTLAVGAFASVFTEPSIATWYAGLIRPAFAPPNWLLAPVWTTLYVLMAVAAWRVWRLRSASPAREAPAAGRDSRSSEPSASLDRWRLLNIEMGAYAAQLIFNFGWTAIFFAAHQVGLAFVAICILFVLVLAATILFWRRDRLAGLLFLPYLAWTGFAAVLNHAFWVLNP